MLASGFPRRLPNKPPLSFKNQQSRNKLLYLPHFYNNLATTMSSNVYRFKIVLKGIKPKIWRRIEVPEKYSFWDLHVAIQNAMGWDDYHLHQFEIRNPRTGENETIGILDDEFSGFVMLPTDERTAKIAEYFSSPNDKANYMYDFGDGWEHEIILEKISPAITGYQYPRCTAGKVACPPEDAGGVYGYKEKMKIIANPNHKDYEEIKEWLESTGWSGDDFDPKSVFFENPNNR